MLLPRGDNKVRLCFPSSLSCWSKRAISDQGLRVCSRSLKRRTLRLFSVCARLDWLTAGATSSVQSCVSLEPRPDLRELVRL